jgi:hypothetical protein
MLRMRFYLTRPQLSSGVIQPHVSMPYQSSVSFDGIVVIESLSKPNLLTGTDLFETTIAPAALTNNTFAELRRVATREQFFSALSRAEALANEGHAPIIHLEMHGDKTGLQLTSREIVGWSELAPALTRVNERTKMNLLVVAAACHGWHLSEVLRPVDRAPAWGIIGPPDSIGERDLYDAMKRFYASLWTSVDLREALNSGNESPDISDWRFRIQSADLLYCRVFRWYLESFREESQADRLNRLVAEAARLQRLDVTQTMQLRANFARDLDNHQFWFDHYKTHFLMLDLFPENAPRFELQLSDCLPQAE